MLAQSRRRETHAATPSSWRRVDGVEVMIQQRLRPFDFHTGPYETWASLASSSNQVCQTVQAYARIGQAIYCALGMPDDGKDKVAEAGAKFRMGQLEVFLKGFKNATFCISKKVLDPTEAPDVVRYHREVAAKVAMLADLDWETWKHIPNDTVIWNDTGKVQTIDEHTGQVGIVFELREWWEGYPENKGNRKCRELWKGRGKDATFKGCVRIGVKWKVNVEKYTLADAAFVKMHGREPTGGEVKKVWAALEKDPMNDVVPPVEAGEADRYSRFARLSFMVKEARDPTDDELSRFTDKIARAFHRAVREAVNRDGSDSDDSIEDLTSTDQVGNVDDDDQGAGPPEQPLSGSGGAADPFVIEDTPPEEAGAAMEEDDGEGHGDDNNNSSVDDDDEEEVAEDGSSSSSSSPESGAEETDRVLRSNKPNPEQVAQAQPLDEDDEAVFEFD